MADPIELEFEWGDLRLAGSLHLPDGRGPHPAVVMSQGSGPADRDSGGYFPPIRMAFVERGIATCSFDKPGCGRSTGDWRDHGLGDRTDQLVAAVEHVRLRPEIAADRVGVFGHSQGGWVVQQAAARRIPLAFAICSAAPTIDVSEQTVYDNEQRLIAAGVGPDDVAEALTYLRSVQRAAVDGADLATVVRDLIEPASRRPWIGHVATIDDDLDWHLFRRFVTEPHDPVADLRRVACPILAVFGGRDVLLPAWRCAEETGRALDIAHTDDATTMVFPLGNHRLQHPGTERFVDGYLDLLVTWAAGRI